MAYDPPDKFEMTTINQLERIHNRIEKFWFSRPTSKIDIPLSFAKEGVRCNHTQELNSIVDIYQGFIDTRLEAQTILDDTIQIMKLTNEAIELFYKNFTHCPCCEGKKGTGSSGNWDWEDCCKCDGRGVLPRNNI